jgi:hypothetical protein
VSAISPGFPQDWLTAPGTVLLQRISIVGLGTGPTPVTMAIRFFGDWMLCHGLCLRSTIRDGINLTEANIRLHFSPA